MVRKVVAAKPKTKLTKRGEDTTRIVIADSSPIIGLSLIGGLGWLHTLFGEICITKIVRDELLHGFKTDPKPGMNDIAHAILLGDLKVLPRDWVQPLFPHLDEGEASVLRAAAHQTARCLVIIDETLGRRAAAEMCNARGKSIAVTGLVGVVIAAKQKKLISKVEPVLIRLNQAGFRLSDMLVMDALVRSGERLHA